MRLVGIFVCLFFSENVEGRLMDRTPVDTSARVMVAVDFECASAAGFPRKTLRKVVRLALSRTGDHGQKWADRAFRYNLDQLGRQEYLVPLSCSAVGNCAWGVFAVRPARLLGIVYGEFLYPRKPLARWPAITTTSHLSASDSMLVTYCFRGGRYVECSRPREISAYRGDEPKFMDRVQPRCDPGWRPVRSK